MGTRTLKEFAWTGTGPVQVLAKPNTHPIENLKTWKNRLLRSQMLRLCMIFNAFYCSTRELHYTSVTLPRFYDIA